MARSSSRFPFMICCTLCLLVTISAHAKGERMLNKQLKTTMAEVKQGQTSTLRTNAAQRLSELTDGIDPRAVSEDVLTEMVSLLDTSEDSVRYWVALSLGNIGPRARMAVPKLLKILDEVDCVRKDLTSAPAIRIALEQMGVKPPPHSCQTKM